MRSNDRGVRPAGADAEPALLSVAETSSFPSPARDYYHGGVSLDRELISQPAATFIVRVGSDVLREMGIHQGDELIVDRSLDPRPGRVLVVVHDDEHRIGRFETHDGRAWLVTDLEEMPLTADVEPWGVATVVIHHLLPAPSRAGTTARASKRHPTGTR